MTKFSTSFFVSQNNYSVKSDNRVSQCIHDYETNKHSKYYLNNSFKDAVDHNILHNCVLTNIVCCL